MKVIHKINELRVELAQYYHSEQSIGFVPTMGCLHQGHLKLMKNAVKENDIVVLSIFVNPTQFGPEEDYEEYPRNFKKDFTKARETGVDYIFNPEVEEMYSEGYNTFVEVEKLTEKLCGASRPEHFRGVTTVVTKLFNIVRPDIAYFGQKDFQQFVVIKRLVKDLNFPLKLEMVPIAREDDGLAISSRNKYLNKREREAAGVLYQALQKGENMILKGERNAYKVEEKMKDLIKDEELASIDYVKAVEPETLEDIEKISKEVLLAVAVFIGETRLIDNFYIEEIAGN